MRLTFRRLFKWKVIISVTLLLCIQHLLKSKLSHQLYQNVTTGQMKSQTDSIAAEGWPMTSVYPKLWRKMIGETGDKFVTNSAEFLAEHDGERDDDRDSEYNDGRDTAHTGWRDNDRDSEFNDGRDTTRTEWRDNDRDREFNDGRDTVRIELRDNGRDSEFNNERDTAQTELRDNDIKGSEINIMENENFANSANNGKYTPAMSWLTMFPARGRLGNQMFQLASLFGIANTLQHRPFISPSAFDIDQIFSVPNLERKQMNISEFKQFKEQGASALPECDITQFTDVSVVKTGGNWTLDGYFQSFKYFDHIRDDIRKLFTFRENVMTQAKIFINSNTSPWMVKIGIHVRRGDFLNDYHTGLGRVTPGLDDIPWCRNNFHGNQERVIFSPYKHPGYDIAAMSQCDHMILSVGTFGWWGGWLAGGSVVYFDGYPKPGSKISKHFVKEDLYPTDWIGMT